MTIFSTPSLTGVSIPLDTCICQDLLLTLFKLLVRSETHFIRSLSRYFSIFSPKLSHLTPIFVPQGFFKLFQEFLHLSCLRNLSIDPLQPGTLFIPELLRPLILHYLIFGSVMKMPIRHSRRTFLDEAFIRNAKSYCQTLPTPTFLLSFTVGDGSHYVTSQSPVLLCLSKSFTPTCMGLIVQYLFSSLTFKVRAFLSHRNLLRMSFESLG